MFSCRCRNKLGLIVLFSSILWATPIFFVQVVNCREASKEFDNVPNDTLKGISGEATDLWAFKYYITLVEKMRNDSEQSEMMQSLQETFMTQLKINAALERDYGVRFKDAKWMRCAREYAERKKEFEEELQILRAVCNEQFDQISFGSLQNKDEGWKQLLGHCAHRASELPEVVKDLRVTLNISLFCSVWTTKRVLNELKSSNYFENIEEANELWSWELQFLMDTYEAYNLKDYNSTLNTENILPLQTELRRATVEQIVADKVKLREINLKKWQEPRHETLTNLKEAITKIPALNLSFEVMQSVSDSLNQIFRKYLDVSMYHENVPPNYLFTLILINAHLREGVSRYSTVLKDVSAKIPKSKLNLYTGASPTLGKRCESSEVHPVGTCTPENNEICVRSSEQDPHDPRRRSMITILPDRKLCQCSQETCSEHEGGKQQGSPCPLTPNAKGQCRGAKGYPCKSQPLSPEKYDESCESELCNLRKDRCELPNDGKDPSDISRLKRKLKILLTQ